MTKYQKLVKTVRYKNSNTWLRTTHKGGGGTGREVKSWFRRMGMTSKAPTVRVKPESYRQNYVEKEISLSPVMPPPPPPPEKTHIITASKKDLADARTALQDEENMREPGPGRIGRISVNTKAMNDAFDAFAKQIIAIISSTGIAKADNDFLYALQAIVFDEKINPQNYPNYPSHTDYNPYLYGLAASEKDLADARSAVLDEEIMRHPPAVIGKGRIGVNTKAMNDALDARAKQLSLRRTAKDDDDFSNALHAIVFDERTNPQNYPNYPSHVDYNLQLYRLAASEKDLEDARSAVLDEETMRHPPPVIGKGRISVNTKAMNDALDARAKLLSSRRTAKDYDDYSNALHAIVFDERTNPQNYPNYPSHADYNPQLYATTASGRKYRKSGKSGKSGTTKRTKRGKK